MCSMASTSATTSCCLMSMCWIGLMRSSCFVGIAIPEYQQRPRHYRRFVLIYDDRRGEYGANNHEVLSSPVTLLCHDKSPRRGQQYDGQQAFGFHPEGRFTNHFQVRAGVVQKDKALRIDLRQKALYLGFANRHITVAEEDVNPALDFHFQA